MTSRSRLWLTVGAFVGVLAFLGSDAAEARNRRPRGGRRLRSMLSAKGPNKGRTPDGVNSDPATGSGGMGPMSSDVAGSPAEGDGRKNELQGGTAIVLSPTRALVTNPYRGLLVVDVTNPDAPQVLGSVALGGSADRVFVDGTTALVISQMYDAGGGRTRVTAIDLSDEANPAILGDVSVDGGLVNAAQSGADLIVVTSSFTYGPYMMFGDPNIAYPAADSGQPGALGGLAPKARGGTASGSPNGSAGNADDGVVSPEFWYPWGGDGKARVARITRGAAGAPEILGTVEVGGSLLANEIDGDGVALVVDDTYWGPGPIETYQADPSFAATGVKLVDVDATGVPQVDGRTLLDLAGVTQFDLAGTVARVFGWDYNGATRLETYGFGAGDPAAMGGIDVADWPYLSVFAGDRFAYATTVYPYTEPYAGGDRGGNILMPAKDPAQGDLEPSLPSTTLHVIDLSDAANPVNGGSVDLGDGWSASLQVANGSVVATVSDYSTPGTHLSRVDLADAANPAIAASADFDGSWYGFQVEGDLMLLSGGTYTDAGGYVPQVLPVSLAGGGLQVGGAIGTQSWASASAWSTPILALTSVDMLALYDLSDFAHPATRGSVRLAANVTDLAILDDTTAACLVTDYVGGSIEVRTVSLPGADALSPLDTVTVGTGDARLFRNGSMLYVVASDWSTGGGRVSVVDAKDPSNLALRGSLDLASYPGQSFLVDDALVLVRDVWSLIATDETTGRRRPKADAFGRARMGWTRDSLSAVLDVVDLSDPDAPRPAVRRRLRWDFNGEAILNGKSLYVPQYTSYGWSNWGWERVLYGVRTIDLSNPLKPRIGRVHDVPGTLVGATADAGHVLTVSYDYDQDSYDFNATLHLVDIGVNDWRGHVIASRDLVGTPDTVVAGAEHAYVATQAWNFDDAVGSYTLETLGAADLSLASTQTREQSAWGGRVAGGCLFLRSWGWTGAIDVYGLTDPASPAFLTRADVDGVGTTIGVAGSRAYVPGGYRGVLGFDLSK